MPGARQLSAAIGATIYLSAEGGKGYLNGSIRVHFGHLPSRLDELPRDRKIVVYCAGGGRSPIAYSVLRWAGFKNVQELPEGLACVESN